MFRVELALIMFQFFSGRRPSVAGATAKGCLYRQAGPTRKATPTSTTASSSTLSSFICASPRFQRAVLIVPIVAVNLDCARVDSFVVGTIFFVSFTFHGTVGFSVSLGLVPFSRASSIAFFVFFFFHLPSCSSVASPHYSSFFLFSFFFLSHFSIFSLSSPRSYLVL